MSASQTLIDNLQKQINKHQPEKQKRCRQIDFDKDIVSKPESHNENEKFKIINQIDINQKHILLATANGLYLLQNNKQSNNDQNLKKTKILSEEAYDSAFIPQSHYIAYCLQKTTERQFLCIYNWKEKKLSVRIKISFMIQQIKPSKSCISLASEDEIFVVHFPSLKPIYNGPAGNSARIVYDISHQGLTLAHNSTERGELIIRNFTNIKRNKAITERKKSIFSSRVKLQMSKLSNLGGIFYSSSLLQEQQVEPQIKIKAHVDMISQIRVSPNGSKVVTASLKGTVLRIFSTKNGNKLQEFRVGYELLKIVDVSFVKDGNIVGCMNEKGSIMLFNVSMDKDEKQYETQRIGHKIYTQKNPKSFFSFLSVFYPPLNDSFPFNYYQLINPQYKQDPIQIPLDMNNIMDKSFSKSESVYEDQKSQTKSKMKLNHSIQQLDEEHVDDFIGKKQCSLISQDTNKKQLQKNSQPENSNIDPKIQRISLKVPQTYRNSSPQKPKSLLVDPRSFSSTSLSKLKPISLDKKHSSISARTQKLRKQQTFQRPFYNLVSKLYITQGNYIWAIKGYHIFGLKYDSFHGGEMILDFNTKIQ